MILNYVILFMVSIKIHALPGVTLPSYQSRGASGADICAFLAEPITLQPGETKLIPTGLTMEIPEGYEAQIRPGAVLPSTMALPCSTRRGPLIRIIAAKSRLS